MKRFLAFVVLLCGFPGYAGDNVSEYQEIVGANARGEFLVLEKWHVEGSQTTEPYPMFFGIFRFTGTLSQFVEIPLLAGLNRKDMDESYEQKAKSKWKELLAAFKIAGFQEQGISPLDFKVNSAGYATVILPDGSRIEERSKVLPRKKNDLQREQISLWRTPKEATRAVLFKDRAIQTVVRSFSHREIQKAYWLKENQTVVALYNNPAQSASDRQDDLWVAQLE